MHQEEISLTTTSHVLQQCLDTTQHDEILLISDDGDFSVDLASAYIQSGEQLGVKLTHIQQHPETELGTASVQLVQALRQLPENNVVILCVSNKLGGIGALGKSFRRFCQQRKHRFISTTGLGSMTVQQFPVLWRAMNVDYMKMQLHGLWLKKHLDNASTLRITTDAGTNVTVDVFGMQAIANTGNYRQTGSGGNIPAGEVYMAPRGTNNVHGKVVVDGSMRTDKGTLLLKYPVTLHIKNGRVVDITGNDAAVLEAALKRAEQRAKYPERIRIIGEVGFGINPAAEIIGTTIVDEKAYDTAHIAIGSNYWFGGANKTIFHADQVFTSPTLFIDGEKVSIGSER